MAAPRTKKRRVVLTPEQSQHRREIALRHKPWLHARGKHTGPRTEAGKARSRLNARKHGERDARARATRAFIVNVRHMTQLIGARVAAELDESPKLTYFLEHATLRTLEATIAQLKNELPDDDAGTTEWTAWLKRHRELGQRCRTG